MNCLWLLLAIAFCGNNGCGNGCHKECDWYSNRCNNCNDCRECENRVGRDRPCEKVCETVCETVCDAVEEASERSCGCRKTFPFTSYPVLDDCN